MQDRHNVQCRHWLCEEQWRFLKNDISLANGSRGVEADQAGQAQLAVKGALVKVDGKKLYLMKIVLVLVLMHNHGGSIICYCCWC